jgi:hypothetical protein
MIGWKLTIRVLMIEKSSIEANYFDLKGMKIQSVRKIELNYTVSRTMNGKNIANSNYSDLSQ